MVNQYLLQVLQASSEKLSESEFKLKVTGTSMSPFIKLGDDIFVKHEPLSSLSVGDVLVIIRENDIVTHRLVKINPDNYVCKGDNTHVPDPPVKGEQIFGRVIAIQRAGKWIVLDGEGWKTRNKIMGWLGNLENQLYCMTDRLRSQIVKNSEKKTHIFIGRIIFTPFRAIMRLISR